MDGNEAPAGFEHLDSLLQTTDKRVGGDDGEVSETRPLLVFCGASRIIAWCSKIRAVGDIVVN